MLFFMFQTDKTDNMLIKALERFDMMPNVDDKTFFKIMSKYESKYSLYDYFANNKPIGPTARKSVQGRLLYHL
jgi:hypothetical protein